MENNNKKTYWPHMIVGFLFLAFTLSFWTVKSASSIPVQESNKYMLKYQQADININEIISRKNLFDKSYTIKIVDVETVMLELENVRRDKEEKTVLLDKGMNSFNYEITSLNNVIKDDANVTFLLTRPHSRKSDLLIENIVKVDGKYTINDINISKAGRYTLQLKVKIGEAIGYSEIAAYLNP